MDPIKMGLPCVNTRAHMNAAASLNWGPLLWVSLYSDKPIISGLH